jgi:hypothetical protein
MHFGTARRGKGHYSAHESSLTTQGNARPYELSKPLVPRVVIEAYCPSRERVWDQCEDAFTVLQSASDHAASTGHVVALNGTIDLPEVESTLHDADGEPAPV